MSTTFQGAPGWPADSGGSDGTGGPPVYGHVRQADGVPVTGATVTLIEAGGRQAGRSRTGADGSYQVRVAQRGVYTLVAAAAGHQPQAAVVHAGGGPVEHDVLLAGAARLAGTVRAAGTGRPVPGATVALVSAGAR
jgi:Carboxypeptidase regulatory-like domain